VGTLIALASQNDPFYAGLPSRRASAEWFAEVWDRFDLGNRTQHLRRIHYILVSQTALIQFKDGTPYTNTEECWKDLCEASKDALYLGLVPSDGFEDRLNPNPILSFDESGSASLSVEGGPMFEFTYGLPSFPALPDFVFNQPVIAQRYQIELWIEKSTMTRDVLIPLKERYNLNIVSAIGEISEIRCRQFVERALASGKPVRILYVSDFDPAGVSMPVAAARKIEFELRKRGLNLDIQLRPVALTHEQCVRYRLPRTPIKESERRGGAFEERFGEGATELDALEALHPGELGRILEQEIRRYYDDDLKDRTTEAAEEFESELSEIREAAIEPYRDEIKALRQQHRDLGQRWSKLTESLGDEHRTIAERFNSIRRAISESLTAQMPDLDDVDWPEPEEGDEGWKPVPVSRKSKKAIGQSWQKTPFSPHQFNGNSINVGLQMGAVSGGLCDVDLDHMVAVGLAPEFLPRTDAVFGRKSKPCSHQLYISDLHQTERKATIQYPEYVNGKQGKMLVELRVGGNGMGAVTTAPPSMHTSGEKVQWVSEGEPAHVPGDVLKRAVIQLAVATLLVRNYPADTGSGSQSVRHEGALVVGGVLARAGWNSDDIGYTVEVAARSAEDSDWKDRARTAEGAVEVKTNGRAVPGLQRCRECSLRCSSGTSWPEARSVMCWCWPRRRTKQRPCTRMCSAFSRVQRRCGARCVRSRPPRYGWPTT
jgi:hypothetical protein